MGILKLLAVAIQGICNQEGFGESVYLGVGGSVKGCGHMDGGSVGEKDLGVGLGGGGGNSGQSGSDL